ncbi:MAG TPA: extracellular solute-binding protein [Firmicutes bacterium]|jgi:ABC-type glycerol-3-phosphate transport system substrate-binding protein|nr:extracellular solute-binding protein [Bacillota bacterium]
MKWKLGLSLIVVLLITCVAVGVCAEPIKLTIYSNFPKPSVEYDEFRVYLDLYEKLNPGVIIEDLGRAESNDKLITLYAVGEPPDLVGFTTHVTFSLYDRGFIADVPDWLVEKMQANLLPVTIEANTLRGTVMGLPFGNNVTTLYMNTRILADTGQTSKPPATWDDLTAMSKKAFTPDHAGLVTSRDAWSLLRFGVAMLWSMGGDVVDKNGNIIIDDAPFRKVLDYFYEWFRPDSHGVFGYSSVFNTGKAAFQLGIPGQLSALRDLNPNYQEEVAVARIPAGPAGAVANHYGHTYVVTKGPHEEEIWKLLDWFFFTGEGLVKGLTPMGDVCLRRGYPPFHKKDISVGLTQHTDAAFYRGFIESVMVARNYESWYEFGFVSPRIGYGIRDIVSGVPVSQIIEDIVLDLKNQIEESKLQ